MELSTEAIDNQGLFSDHYLENVFGDRPDIEDVFASADEALGRAVEIYAEEKKSLTGTKEGQTEKRFIRPLLDEVLGWDFIVQETVQGQKSFGEPDYALFSEPKTYRTASEEASDGRRERVFRRATALAEAKKWHRSLDGSKEPTLAGGAPSQGTPGAQLLRYFDWTQVSWGLLTNGNKWRLYTTRVPSPVDTYLEFDLEYILEQAHGTAEDPTDARTAFRLFYALFRAEAFREAPTLGRPFIESVFEESVEKGEELEDELTERVFDEVFIKLATGLYEDWRDEADAEIPSEEVLDEIYEATLRLLYRLLFLLYAEERDLLPVRDQRGYYRFSLTRIAREAREEVHEDYVLVGDDLWEDLRRLFNIINTGEADLNVPTYNGHLFDLGSGENAWLDRHTVPDDSLAPALTALTLIDPDDPDSRGVDYKALDVRQLGSIYEGLLEHRLRYAEEALGIVKENGEEVYKPLSETDNPIEIVEQGELYLETDESERKKTGSYYTPHYVVEYIVENTLGPILDDRIEEFEDAMADINAILEDHDPDDRGVEVKLDAPRRRAREALLSIRVCDPAMGSGHFLVHAVDYITNRIGAVALERDWTVNPIREALEDIRSDVLDSLDEQDVQLDDAEARLDDFTLLKRLVMKRCIYGVDLNPMAVELAKLSLWLRSFTVGAPLSFLDHHLKPGNSLIGSQVDEVRRAVEAEGQQFEVFGGPFAGLLQATELMQEVAQLSDATVEEVRESAKHFEDYKDAMRPYKRILDLWVSQHFGNERADYLLRQFGNQVLDVFRGQSDPSDEEQRTTLEQAVELSESKNFFHWELEFPEVYYDLDRSTRKQSPGFDAVIGNPPYVNAIELNEMLSEWEKPYWKKRFESAEGAYDLYVLFFEKALEAARTGRRIGLITPNKYLSAPYATGLRKFVRKNHTIERIRDISQTDVFEDPSVYPTITIIQSGNTVEQKQIKVEIVYEENVHIYEHPRSRLDLLPEMIWGFLLSDGIEAILSINEHSVDLSEVANVVASSTAAESEEFTPAIREKESIEDSEYAKIVNTGLIDRFESLWGSKSLTHRGRGYSNPVLILESDHVPERRYKQYNSPKVIFAKMANQVEALYDGGGSYASINTNFAISDSQTSGFITAVCNSKLISWVYSEYFSSLRMQGGYFQFQAPQLRVLPIPDIDFITSEHERERHCGEIVGTYEADRDAAVNPADSPTFASVENHLDADPERADVVHDLLAHLAREMTELKHERQELERAFDPFKYLPRRTDSTSFSEAFADEIKYAELLDAPVDVTSAQHSVEALRLFQNDDNWVLEARLKKRNPDDWQQWQKDDGRIVREWVPVLRFSTLDEKKARFYRFALLHLESFSNADGDFSGTIIPGGYTSTVKERVWDTSVPVYDPSVDLSDLVSLEREKQRKEHEIAFTDELIDQIVYRLYGLTDEEVAVVES